MWRGCFDHVIYYMKQENRVYNARRLGAIAKLKKIIPLAVGLVFLFGILLSFFGSMFSNQIGDVMEFFWIIIVFLAIFSSFGSAFGKCKVWLESNILVIQDRKKNIERIPISQEVKVKVIKMKSKGNKNMFNFLLNFSLPDRKFSLFFDKEADLDSFVKELEQKTGQEIERGLSFDEVVSSKVFLKKQEVLKQIGRHGYKKEVIISEPVSNSTPPTVTNLNFSAEAGDKVRIALLIILVVGGVIAYFGFFR